MIVPCGVKKRTGRLGKTFSCPLALSRGMNGLAAATPRPRRNERRELCGLNGWPKVVIPFSLDTGAAVSERFVGRHDGSEQLAHVELGGLEGVVRGLDRAAIVIGLGTPEGIPEPLPRHALADLDARRRFVGQLDGTVEGSVEVEGPVTFPTRIDREVVLGAAEGADGIVGLEAEADAVDERGGKPRTRDRLVGGKALARRRVR
jgi:hypothetical protein